MSSKAAFRAAERIALDLLSEGAPLVVGDAAAIIDEEMSELSDARLDAAERHAALLTGEIEGWRKWWDEEQRARRERAALAAMTGMLAYEGNHAEGYEYVCAIEALRQGDAMLKALDAGAGEGGAQ